MNSPAITRRSACKRRVVVMASVGLLLCSRSLAGAFVVYYTGFETNDGYFNTNSLVSHPDWEGQGSGGNRITSLIPGQGQQAYVGFNPPTAGFDFLSVRHPLNFYPVSSNSPVVTFTALIGIGDSNNGYRDDFYWSAYNTHSNYLFTLNFNNEDLKIYYALDGTNSNFQLTGWTFENSTTYTLTITMDFESNNWSAFVGSSMVVTNRPITTTNAELSLGYVAAEWAIRNTNSSGNNYMLFDNYEITAEIVQPQSPHLLVLGHQSGGYISLRVTGQSNYQFAIDASTNLAGWTPLGTNVTTGGFFDLVDTSAVGMPQRLYRARWVQ